jgi:hypothetical protein
MTVRRWLRRFAPVMLAFPLAAVTLMMFPPGADAHDVKYGYWACTQQSKLASGALTVGWDNLPGDGSGDGVVNSFRDRLADATSALSTALKSRNPWGSGLTYVGQVSSNPRYWPNIVFRYTSLEPGALGRTNVSPSGCDNSVHGSIVNLAESISVDLAVRSDWFTQDNSRRALWEACPSNGYVPAYTCSKEHDAGSVILHELGHGIGLAHPRQTDQHIYGYAPNQVMALAKCGVVLDQATMCQAGDAAGGGRYRTHRRTLHSWDTSSIAAAY